jgi:hypothetical protein
VKTFAALWLRGIVVAALGALGLFVVVSNAPAQTADCQAEAESVSGSYGSSATGGALPGSVSGSGEPGASNSGATSREALKATVYDACLKRRPGNEPQLRREPSTPAQPSPTQPQKSR